jgi:hypothetical protein
VSRGKVAERGAISVTGDQRVPLLLLPCLNSQHEQVIDQPEHDHQPIVGNPDENRNERIRDIFHQSALRVLSGQAPVALAGGLCPYVLRPPYLASRASISLAMSLFRAQASIPFAAKPQPTRTSNPAISICILPASDVGDSMTQNKKMRGESSRKSTIFHGIPVS